MACTVPFLLHQRHNKGNIHTHIEKLQAYIKSKSEALDLHLISICMEIYMYLFSLWEIVSVMSTLTLKSEKWCGKKKNQHLLFGVNEFDYSELSHICDPGWITSIGPCTDRLLLMWDVLMGNWGSIHQCSLQIHQTTLMKTVILSCQTRELLPSCQLVCLELVF